MACNDRETNPYVVIINATISCLTIFAPKDILVIGYLQMFSRVLQECSCLCAWEIQRCLKCFLILRNECRVEMLKCVFLKVK